MKAGSRSAAKPDGSPRYIENWIDYILLTGGLAAPG